jgi:hypothetical protein
MSTRTSFNWDCVILEQTVSTAEKQATRVRNIGHITRIANSNKLIHLTHNQSHILARLLVSFLYIHGKLTWRRATIWLWLWAKWMSFLAIQVICPIFLTFVVYFPAAGTVCCKSTQFHLKEVLIYINSAYGDISHELVFHLSLLFVLLQ